MSFRSAFASILVLAAAIVILSPRDGRAAEEILQWHSYIKVQEDGSMTVTESIRVRAEGSRIKRGIYRDFPTIYKDRSGNRVNVDFKILSVKRDGRTEPYHTEKMSNGVRIYFGERSVFLSKGVHNYDFTYRTDRQLGFFEDHDELYWNVTGNGWDFRILKVTATVVLPQPVPDEQLTMASYMGPHGSTEKGMLQGFAVPGEARFASGRILDPNEGFTIVLGWPKGVVAEPGRAQRAASFLSDNRSIGTALGGLLLLLAYYLWAWKKVGKDPEAGTVIPRFEPPDNLSPAATRFLTEMAYDNRAFASAIINLAVKGFITIHDEGGILGFGETYVLKRTDGDLKYPLSSGEQKIARKLFPARSKTLKLEKKSHKKISGAMGALKELLKTEYEKAHFKNNGAYFGAGIVLSVIVLIAAAVAGGQTGGGPPLIFIILWLTPWSAATYFLWSTRKFLMAAVFSIFLVMASGVFANNTSPGLVVSILFMVALNLLFYRLLKAPTNLGRRVLDKIEGFKMYLATAEEDRLARLHPPEKTPELFEKYLPYALALEVDQEWSEKFAGVLARAAATRDYSPGWYHGNHWNSMSTGSFASGLGAGLSSAISSSSTAPGSSSGFGGGGGSGGGGGGGGGGGW